VRTGEEVSAAVSALALAEIAVFRAHLRQVTWELVDASTGDVLVRDVPREGRRVRSGDGEAFDLGASAAGVFFVPAAVPAAGTIDRTLARLQPPSCRTTTPACPPPRSSPRPTSSSRPPPRGPR
jgi:hypothetical protein